MKNMYHATDAKNVNSILNEGIKIGFEGVVYLAETEEDAVNFVSSRATLPNEITEEVASIFPQLRVMNEIAVFEVLVKDELLKESFDHNSNLLHQCKAYYVDFPIQPQEIINIEYYDIV